MLKFNNHGLEKWGLMLNLNTSYVKVQHSLQTVWDMGIVHLNTSYVKVQLITVLVLSIVLSI